MKLYIKSVQVSDAAREHRADTQKQFSCKITLEVASIGEFPLDADNPRGTEAAVQELARHLLQMHISTGQDTAIAGH